MCHCGLKSSKEIWKYALTMPLFVYVSETRKLQNKGHGHCVFPSKIIIARQTPVNLSTTVLKAAPSQT